VNSGSYLRTVFVLISGITTFPGFAGSGAAFLSSGLKATGEVSFTSCLKAVFFASVLTGAGVLAAGCWAGLAGAGCAVFGAGWADAGFLEAGVAAAFFDEPAGLAGDFAEAGLAAGFFDTGTFFLDSFLTGFAGAGLLAAGFFAAGFAAFFGCAFFTDFTGFFLTAIPLGFFCNEHR
jgi:hypothetical protein